MPRSTRDSGRAALSIISQQRPAIVLLDWMMPELSGLETLRAIRELYPKRLLPVIMCTAMDEEMSVVAAINEGANDYMLKPISLPILRARMSVHLAQRDAIDTLMSEKQHAERSWASRPVRCSSPWRANATMRARPTRRRSIDEARPPALRAESPRTTGAAAVLRSSGGRRSRSPNAREH